ncbi:hypothetical protein TZ03_25185 [Pseudomonas sp. 10-1B]|nr:hypothetical protein TZ03_25185 [Pseudomonas sp. 10-1B]
MSDAQREGITAAQLLVGFVFVLNLTTQLAEGAHHLTGGAVLVTTMNGLYACSTSSEVLMPVLCTCESLSAGKDDANCQALAEAIREFALGTVDLAVQLIAAVVQVVELPTIRRQCGQVAERIVFVVQRTTRAQFLCQPPQQIIAVAHIFIGDTQLLARPCWVALDAQ